MCANDFQSYVFTLYDNYTDVYEAYSKGLDFFCWFSIRQQNE